MVAAKSHGKSRVGSTRVSEDVQSRKNEIGTGGCRNFKVYMENEQVKVGDGLLKYAREASASSRRSGLMSNKGVIQSSATNSKGGFQSVEKSSGKYGSSANVNVRKALADVSNVQFKHARNIGRDGSKSKVSEGSDTSTLKASSRKSFTARVQEHVSRGDVQLDASKTVRTDLRASLEEQKISLNGSRPSVVTEDRTARKPFVLTITRKSLPVPRRGCRADMSNTKENARSSGTAEGKSGIPTKATTGRKVTSQHILSRSHLSRTRVSDGFVQTVRTNVQNATSRRSIKPPVKTTIKASDTQRTLKLQSKPGLNKSASAAAVSSCDKEAAALSIPENGSAVVSIDASEGQLLSSGQSNLDTNSSEFIARKKSTRRKSYTTLLMERSKFLKESHEVLEQDSLPSIDDECNQLEVSEYIDEIYHYYWVTEAESPFLANYMSIQTEITPHMRGILINWLIEVHFKFDLMPETLYLTVTLLDQYLSLVTIKTNDMQLVGLTALLLASKYEDFWHPRVKDLISISAESYTRDHMLGMEKLILRKLKFRLNAPTPYVFMVRFLKAAQSDMKLEHLAFFLIELCLVEYEALAFKPSLLCASAIYVGRCTLQITPAWTPLLRKHARYEVSQFRNCAETILKFHRAARTGNLKVTYEKYSRPERSGVAAVKPLDRLPFDSTCA